VRKRKANAPTIATRAWAMENVRATADSAIFTGKAVEQQGGNDSKGGYRYVVQNRCYAERGWDRAIRALCAEHGIVYQEFSLLTANRDVVVHREVRAIAARHGKTPAQIIFRFARQAGMLPLTGTSSPAHMREDLAIDDFALDAQELATIDAAGER
jgi:diketogulonate reductase-like aldo/keto reductase